MKSEPLIPGGGRVLFTYRIPRVPSGPRVAVWRRLKAPGVVQLGDGLVALPADARTREHFDWIADQVRRAGGTANLWLSQRCCPRRRHGPRRRGASRLKQPDILDRWRRNCQRIPVQAGSAGGSWHPALTTWRPPRP
ncbi:Chromate resistance protein ChrB [Pseudarthrobacter sp. TAF60_1]|uniref:Chromate resistance protein ChrB n=1 Tax=Pseudarthrobacter sp. TAF60_1 TaxID=3233071 RepID=UPI003F950AA7